MKHLLPQTFFFSFLKAGLLACLLMACPRPANAQGAKKTSNQFLTGYQYLLRGNQRTPMRYTRSYSGSNGVFVTTYKLYHPVKGTHALTITATHYKDDQKVVVEINDTSGSIFSEINKQETSYDGTPFEPFGFRGTAGALGGPNVPNQLGLQFASGKAENVKVLSIIGSREDFEFFVLDKKALLKPVAEAKPSRLQEAKALYGGPKHIPDSKPMEPDSTENPMPEATVDTPSDDKVYTSVDQMPQLPGGGGGEAISEAIQNATKYPPIALRNQVQGRLIVSFIVEPQGNVSDVRVAKGLGFGLDDEVMQAVKSLPAFIPGKQNGRAVRVSYTLPVDLAIRPKSEAVPPADANPKSSSHGHKGWLLIGLVVAATVLRLVTAHP